MAKAPDGILSPVSGSVGKFTFYKLNGQAIVRKKASYIDKPTSAQLRTRQSMKILMNFLTRVKPFIKAGFTNQSRGTVRSYFNTAMSYNLRHAMKLENDEYAIHFPSVQLSEGTALPAREAKATLTAEGLTFSWLTDPMLNWITQNDQVMMMAYFPEEESGIFQTSGARRKLGQDTLPLPKSLLDKRMEVYLAFISDDRSSVSTSQYLGQINGV